MQKSKIILNFYMIVLKVHIPGKIILDFKSKVYIRKLCHNVVPVDRIRFRAVDLGRVHMTQK